MERFGEFNRLAEPDIYWKIPLGFEKVASRQSLRIRQLNLDVVTKTHNDVFDTSRKLADHIIQMNSWVFDVVGLKVLTMKLD